MIADDFLRFEALHLATKRVFEGLARFHGLQDSVQELPEFCCFLGIPPPLPSSRGLDDPERQPQHVGPDAERTFRRGFPSGVSLGDFNDLVVPPFTRGRAVLVLVPKIKVFLLRPMVV